MIKSLLFSSLNILSLFGTSWFRFWDSGVSVNLFLLSGLCLLLYVPIFFRTIKSNYEFSLFYIALLFLSVEIFYFLLSVVLILLNLDFVLLMIQNSRLTFTFIYLVLFNYLLVHFLRKKYLHQFNKEFLYTAVTLFTYITFARIFSIEGLQGLLLDNLAFFSLIGILVQIWFFYFVLKNLTKNMIHENPVINH